MTFPAGRLPDAGFLADLGLRAVPSKSVAFTSGGSDLDLTDPANGLVPCASSLYVTSIGNIVAQLAGDSAPRTYAIAAAGTVLPGAFVLVKGTSTANAICRQ